MNYTMTAMCSRYIIILVNTTPSVKDLYEHITPHFAAVWKEIGILLGLPTGELTAIGADNCSVKRCCNDMLEKWLSVDPNASWEKLFTVIDSRAVSSGHIVDKGSDKGDLAIGL